MLSRSYYNMQIIHNRYGSFSFSSPVLQMPALRKNEQGNQCVYMCMKALIGRQARVRSCLYGATWSWAGAGHMSLRPIVERRGVMAACEGKRSGTKRSTDRRTDGRVYCTTTVCLSRGGELGQERGVWNAGFDAAACWH